MCPYPENTAPTSGRPTALITGAARGIGAETARTLAQRGWNVALTGLEPENLAQVAAGIGDRAAWFEADVTDADQLQAAVAGAIDCFGGIDTLVANAGIVSYGTVHATDPQAWVQTIEVNINGAFHAIRAALPAIIERRGYILVVSSVGAFAPLPGLSAYAASKAAVESLASVLAAEMGLYGVKLGSAHPSWINTDMVRDANTDLSSFHQVLSLLPWPLRTITSLEKCAKSIADGVERRKRHVFVPGSIRILYWARAFIQSEPAIRLAARISKPVIPQLDAEVKALGRSMSKRTIGNTSATHA
jgi:NAD(P)-dependent dehydrogenase (short-subunit alcohol dehydrogenase family)